MSAENLEQRVAELEKELALLKKMLSSASGKPWWEKIAGTFENDPAHQEAYELGRAYRQSQSPAAND